MADKSISMSQSITAAGSAWRTRLISHVQTPLYRNAYALIFSSVVGSGLGMFYWVIAANYYTTEIVGLNAAAISAMTFLSGVSRLNLDSALFRFIPQAGPATGRLVMYTYVISQVLAAIIGIIFLLGLGIWAPAL